MDIYEEISSIKQTQEETLALLKKLHSDGVVENKGKVYDLTDLVDILHVSKRTLFKWKSAGHMKFTQIGKKLFLTNSELKRFLETHKQN